MSLINDHIFSNYVLKPILFKGQLVFCSIRHFIQTF